MYAITVLRMKTFKKDQKKEKKKKRRHRNEHFKHKLADQGNSRGRQNWLKFKK